MNKELANKIDELLVEIAFLKMDWSDLGWDVDGNPEGELCDEFENKLARIEDKASELANLRNKLFKN